VKWLDPQTKEILQKDEEPKLAPPKLVDFALVLLQKGTDHPRLKRAIRRINDCNEAVAAELAALPTPAVMRRDMSEEDALLGQFELVCCDSISVFLRTEVLLHGDQDYLRRLFDSILESDEFKPVAVIVAALPLVEAGTKFVDQFLGNPDPAPHWNFPSLVICPFKKARIMKHWAARIGGEVRFQVKP
jgi:hypothetical protein